jgi:hypothetical protein
MVNMHAPHLGILAVTWPLYGDDTVQPIALSLAI